MTMQEATYFLLNKLRTIYPEGEADQVTDWVMEHLTGSKKAERMIYKNSAITDKEESDLKQFTERLMQHEPVQYVLNESWFCGLKLYVDKNVLVPRPETEELVEWVIANCKFPIDELSILDIGTGSGCIPIALKRKLRKAEVWSCDISEAALQVAKRNADTLGAAVNFLLLDFLNQEERRRLSSFDIIISNPPYVPEKDKEKMHSNVLNYEPHTALFVPDNDALVFYEAIAEFGAGHLNPGGSIYVEIHEELGSAISSLFASKGYKTELKKDMQGKERMIKALI
ncbi:MAG TPA: peptide chain release factor N(5)-glutamine methyltransferase [Chitinophagaceae bacterium]|nr:peptide chain release factor N(5)-glutamine methyltransferase [Chitinophagaceae bacterium]